MVLFFSAYLPPAKPDADGNTRQEYDEDAGSLFWALNVPSTYLPEGGLESIRDRTNFCLEGIANWSPRYHDLLRSVDDKDVYAFQPYASKKASQKLAREGDYHRYGGERPSSSLANRRCYSSNASRARNVAIRL
ncbi:FAD/NAD(P)-binding domain-containing protein [Penicillium daleae]|uniref:FAD/NAD(P)-binding domain-containing protein n=1 Tax=Penicillium daleae TaxID=63821 RepID=A0AAD6G4V0_9EURO|nr:FAD/NAD(P)-binding domain-containing protein [Penicillium daleae]KAJ5454569.1 FAD/NAD(P)-binding domain-containing protein [Penicillium daleae]